MYRITTQRLALPNWGGCVFMWFNFFLLAATFADFESKWPVKRAGLMATTQLPWTDTATLLAPLAQRGGYESQTCLTQAKMLADMLQDGMLNRNKQLWVPISLWRINLLVTSIPSPHLQIINNRKLNFKKKWEKKRYLKYRTQSLLKGVSLRDIKALVHLQWTTSAGRNLKTFAGCLC